MHDQAPCFKCAVWETVIVAIKLCLHRVTIFYNSLKDAEEIKNFL